MTSWTLTSVSELIGQLSLVPSLAARLIYFLLLGTGTWLVMFIRLAAFTLCLTPGWMQLLRYYLFSTHIDRNQKYGAGPLNRNFLDVYHPHPGRVHATGKAPILIFVSGGAWIIGHKLWSALIARAFTTRGVIVVVPDYRNFPQGTCDDMMVDINLAVVWTKENAQRIGGDPQNIVLAGQSAGAHISLCMLLWPLSQALARGEDSDSTRTATEDKTTSSKLSWLCSWFNFGKRAVNTAPCISLSAIEHVRCFIGISGPYDLKLLETHLHERGLDSSILKWICQGKLAQYSPATVLRKYADLSETRKEELRSLLPRSLSLFHGSCDKSIPVGGSKLLEREARAAGIYATACIYDRWTHTDGILEKIFLGDTRLIDDMMQVLSLANGDWKDSISLQNQREQIKEDNWPVVYPRVLVSMASFCNPF